MDLDAIRLALPTHKADYDQRVTDAEQVREVVYGLVRAAAAGGMPQTEIVSLTGWTRETIRKIVAGKVKA